MAQISKMNPARTTIGARVILRKLKISSWLKTFGSFDFPPIISIKPITIMANPIKRRK
jgi:hypothetical protein